MRAKKLFLPLVALAALLALVAAMAGLFSERLQPGLDSRSQVTAEDLAEVTVEERPLFEPVPATLRARETSAVAARILASVTRVHVRAGDNVRAGDLLVELDRRDLEARLARAEEQQRAVAARLEEAERVLRRSRDLFERKLIAQADLDRAEANASSLAAELAAARRAVDEARTALSYSRIVAPFDGRIVDRLVEPGDTAAPGVPLLRIYNPGTLRAEAWVRESRALSLAEGDRLKVRVPALDLALTAEVEERVPSADTGSRSFLIKARIAQDPRLLPGMYAELSIPAGSTRLVTIPADRVARIGQLDLVRVAAEGGVERRFVRLGPVDETGRQQVLAGLEPGEKLLPVVN